MVDTMTIGADPKAAGPSLEEQARKMGIDPNNLDSTAVSQTAPEKVEPKILGKFKSQEELEKAYTELEKKLGTTSKPDTEVKPQEGNEPADADEVDQAKEAADKAGLDFDELSNKFWSNGQLDEEDYETLEKAGYPKDMVDQFTEGQKAIVELQRFKVFSEVGGEQSYSDMVEWGRSNLTEKEISKFNEGVNSDDMDTVLFTVKGLQARYQTSVGVEPRSPIQGSTRYNDNEVYSSRAEMQADMRDPRYQVDPAFRAKVERKLAGSDIF